MPRKYSDILDEVQSDLGIGLDQGRALTQLSDAFRYFWDILPWKETMDDMEPFYIIPGRSYYVEPYINFPEDFRDVYSAELITISDNGTLTWRDLDTIQNMKPGSYMGSVNAVGYNPEYRAVLTDSAPSYVLGQEYIMVVYKKDYPYDLTAENATVNDFPFTRTEGTFKAILGWYLRGAREQEYPARAIYNARLAETPGKQATTKAPVGLFSRLGRYSFND